MSFTGQTVAIGVAILLPLTYTETIPLARVLDFHIAAPAAFPPPAEHNAAVATKAKARVFNDGQLRIPTSIPRNPVIIIDNPEDFVRQSTAVVGSTGPTTGVPGGLDWLTEIRPFIAALPPVVAAPPRVAPKEPAQPTRVSSGVLAAKLIKQVIPVYPPLAKQTHVSGTVHLLGVVGKDGTIQQLQVIDGHPLLRGAALEAVRQWLYRPTYLNGEPVEVIAPIEVRFILNQ